MFRTTSFLIALTAVVGMSACGSTAKTATTPSTPATTPATPIETAAPAPATTPETVPVASEPAASTPTDLSALVGPTWVPASFITVGPLDKIPADSGATLQFTDDGKVLINTGCNTGSAPITYMGADQFAIGPIALTKKACATDAMTLETRIVGLLELPMYWSVDAGALKIYPATVSDSGMILTAA